MSTALSQTAQSVQTPNAAQPTQYDNFVSFLIGFSKNGKDDRAAMATVRRGLNFPPGQYFEMYRYLKPFLSEKVTLGEENVMFRIASLFALHPLHARVGNLGSSFRRSQGEDGNPVAIERRFSALLAADVADLDQHLIRAITFLRSRETPVDWARLYHDVLRWDSPEGYVQRHWARSFWGAHEEADKTGETAE